MIKWSMRKALIYISTCHGQGEIRDCERFDDKALAFYFLSSGQFPGEFATSRISIAGKPPYRGWVISVAKIVNAGRGRGYGKPRGQAHGVPPASPRFGRGLPGAGARRCNVCADRSTHSCGGVNRRSLAISQVQIGPRCAFADANRFADWRIA
jgi:hypothetical protein